MLAAGDGFAGLTQVVFSRRGRGRRRCVRYRSRSSRASAGGCGSTSSAREDGATRPPGAPERTSARSARASASRSPPGSLRVPQLRASWDAARAHATSSSVADLASLRMREDAALVGQLPAAGMPWFMTVFGRDTLITCLQTLLFGPELAQSALQSLAELQATEDDPEIGRGAGQDRPRGAARQGRDGVVPALLRHGRRDAALPRPPLRGLALDRRRWRSSATSASPRSGRSSGSTGYGDLDGDGFVEYRRRSQRGLDNQSWKDSDDSQLFADGRQAEPPIAPCEVQGYVYDAKLRMAEIAREAWRDRELGRAARAGGAGAAGALRRGVLVSSSEAATTRSRSTGRSGGSTRSAPTSATCSGAGSCRRSGWTRSSTQLMGEGLWSGWGVRTMSSADAGYNPLAYHNGSVWPHDNSLIAAGLARYGRWAEAHRIVRRMLEAAEHFDYQLPEVFAGFARTETPFPIAYPTAARPQAWAAGDARPAPPGAARAPSPTGAAGCSRRVLRPSCPPGPRRSGSRPCGRSRQSWEITLEEGVVRVGGSMRVAIISPAWFPVPPPRYGGIESIVALLADGLVGRRARRDARSPRGTRRRRRSSSRSSPRAVGAHRQDALGAPPRARLLRARRGVRRRQRPLGAARGCRSAAP